MKGNGGRTQVLGLGHNHFIIFWEFINGSRYKDIAESVEQLATGTGKEKER